MAEWVGESLGSLQCEISVLYPNPDRKNEACEPGRCSARGSSFIFGFFFGAVPFVNVGNPIFLNI